MSLFKREKYHFEVFNTPIGAVIQWYIKKHFVNDLWYQRDQCWTDKEKQAYLESLFKDKDIGIFIFYEKDVREYVYSGTEQYLEIIDGNNRLHCLKEFYNNELPYIVNGKEYYRKDIDEVNFRHLRNKLVTWKILRGQHRVLSDIDKIQLYLDFNMKGIPQSKEHLEKLNVFLDKNNK